MDGSADIPLEHGDGETPVNEVPLEFWPPCHHHKLPDACRAISIASSYVYSLCLGSPHQAPSDWPENWRNPWAPENDWSNPSTPQQVWLVDSLIAMSLHNGFHPSANVPQRIQNIDAANLYQFVIRCAGRDQTGVIYRHPVAAAAFLHKMMWSIHADIASDTERRNIKPHVAGVVDSGSSSAELQKAEQAADYVLQAVLATYPFNPNMLREELNIKSEEHRL